jgi:sulfotransferase
LNNGIHFISSLPRAGSTLLSALLLQNPKLLAGITSQVGALVAGMLERVSQGNETAVGIDDGQREALLRGVFDNFYHAIHPTRTVFDTNRGWTVRTNLLAALFPDAKIICCVRHIPWIIDSVERLLRQNRWELSKMFGFESGGSVYARADALMAPNGMVGYALQSLKQAMHSDESDRLLLLPYDLLVSDPERAMRAVYDFTGLPHYQHDFAGVSFDATEFDARLGTPGLHKVGPHVAQTERATLLPPDLWQRYEELSVWRDPAFNRRNVRIVM